MTWYVLLQTIQYVTRSKVMDTETRELSSVSRGKIRPQETDDWKNEKLFVPPLPPTNLRGCHLIRIQYDVFVSLRPLPLAKQFNLGSNPCGQLSSTGKHESVQAQKIKKPFSSKSNLAKNRNHVAKGIFTWCKFR